jgi:ADP-heptose:LPS heptosyltransferase
MIEPLLHDHEPIERIVVFRALMLGDLLCAVPALRALRAAFASARITLVGLPWAAALVQRLDCVDDFMPLPGYPGLPEIECDVRQLPDFLAQVQARRHDLSLQLHGSGEVVNPLVALFGARHQAGFARPGVWRPAAHDTLFAPWPETGHEILRLLALTDHLGLPRQGTALEFPVTAADRYELQQIWPGCAAARYVCVHAGAQLPSRRWDPRRFAAVADQVATAGRTVVLTGAPAEASLVADVQACMQTEAVNLCGRTSLWTLGALIERAEAVVCNDTGISHIAAALRRPSVVVSCGSDASRWSPLDHTLHQVLAAPVDCRPCAWRTCPLDEHRCAQDISAAQVLQRLAALPAAGGAPQGGAAQPLSAAW